VIQRAAIAAAALLLLVACPAQTRLVRPTPAPASRPPAAIPIPIPAQPDQDAPAAARALHVVRRGETLYAIARAHGIDPAELMKANGIEDPRALAVGTELFVPAAPGSAGAPRARGPAASVPAATPASGELEALATRAGGPPESRVGSPSAGGAEPPDADGTDATPARLGWPLKGVLYGRYGVRAGQRHDGIDIAAPEGTEVVAAADGSVIYVGEQAAFGEVVILRHEGGLVTLYAHNSAALVKEGARVVRGQAIAKVGQTGRTTGPHLHFEVRQGTRPRNPLLFLP
jgi:lipoprotein NlpD